MSPIGLTAITATCAIIPVSCITFRDRAGYERHLVIAETAIIELQRLPRLQELNIILNMGGKHAVRLTLIQTDVEQR